jgi:2-octaprenyl-6-methoxyphenol hydroxylase
MSLADIKFLSDLDKKYPDELGTTYALNKYQKSRISDIRQRVIGVSTLNQISISGNTAVQNVRAFGLENLFQVASIKNSAMKLGLGYR